MPEVKTWKPNWLKTQPAETPTPVNYPTQLATERVGSVVPPFPHVTAEATEAAIEPSTTLVPQVTQQAGQTTEVQTFGWMTTDETTWHDHGKRIIVPSGEPVNVVASYQIPPGDREIITTSISTYRNHGRNFMAVRIRDWFAAMPDYLVTRINPN